MHTDLLTMVAIDRGRDREKTEWKEREDGERERETEDWGGRKREGGEKRE